MALFGRYYSNNFTTTAGGDLMTQFRTECGVATAVLKKLTLITATDVAVDVNNLGVYSHLYANPDALYVLSLDARDIEVSSLKTEDAGVTVFLAGVF